MFGYGLAGVLGSSCTHKTEHSSETLSFEKATPKLEYVQESKTKNTKKVRLKRLNQKTSF